MQRTIMVRPDAALELPDGNVLEVVSRESLLQAFADMEAVLHVSGGGFTVITQRAATGVPGERVTVAAMIQWQDRTNARSQPEQDEQLYQPPPVYTPPPAAPEEDVLVADLEGQRIALEPADLEAVLAARAARETPPVPEGPPVLSPEEAMRAIEEGIPQQPPAIHPDEPSDPEAEDVSQIPEHAR